MSNNGQGSHTLQRHGALDRGFHGLGHGSAPGYGPRAQPGWAGLVSVRDLLGDGPLRQSYAIDIKKLTDTPGMVVVGLIL